MNNYTQAKELEDYSFKDVFCTRFSKVSCDASAKIIICELRAEYVPIEHFRDTFYRIGELVNAGFNRKLIFDKRSLKAFHQPSMEWYFIYWKRDMYEKGLKVYRKLLPKEEWFQKSVLYAREQILKQHPDNIIDKLDIKYCDTIKEALHV